jgi:hypothetical protein
LIVLFLPDFGMNLADINLRKVFGKEKKMKMIKSVFAILILALVAVPLSADWREDAAKIFLDFSGGMNYLVCGGMNYYFAQTYLATQKEVKQLNRTLTGQMDPLHWGMDLAAEVAWRLNRHWALAVGSGFMQSVMGAGRNWLAQENWWKDSFDTTVKTIPVTLDLRGSFHLRGRFFLTASLGPGLYLAKLKCKHVETFIPANVSYYNSCDAKGTVLGAQGALGLEFRTSRSFSLLFEVTGRYARCDTLTGDSFDSYSQTTSSGTLYFYKNAGWPYIKTCAVQPSGSNYSDVRQLKLNLSGSAARLGIRIRI